MIVHRPIHELDARQAWARWGVVGVLSALLLCSRLYAPWSEDGPILCMVRAWTGVPCPGCGLTRSFCALATGHLGRSFRFHGLGPLLFGALVALVPLLAIEAVRRRRFAWLHATIASRGLVMTLAAGLVVNWVLHMMLEWKSGQLLASVHLSALARTGRLLLQ